MLRSRGGRRRLLLVKRTSTTPSSSEGQERRERLSRAKLLLVFTPDLTSGSSGGDAREAGLDALEAALPFIDIVQVRPKALAIARGPGFRSPAEGRGIPVTRARDAFDWCVLLADLLGQVAADDRPLLMVNDRVDVAKALIDRGLDGVHVGTDDMPTDAARDLLGPDALIGLSTHTTEDLGNAWDAPVDTLGYGPIFATGTKGYGTDAAPAGAPRPLGPERAWLAHESSPVPLFPIGGIDLCNIDQLERVGRAAVGSAVLSALDPGAAAQGLRQALESRPF